MDKRVFLWIANNIDRYEFSFESQKIKDSVKRLLITESSLESDEITEKIEGCYGDLLAVFYNNIFGYQNGLADKAVTAKEFDCYFLRTPEGLVPIGFYKETHPVEATILIQKYLDECEKDIAVEKSKFILGCQNALDDIADKRSKISTSKNPGLFKAFAGIFLAVILLITVVYTFIKTNILTLFFGIGRYAESNAFNFVDKPDTMHIVFAIILAVLALYAVLTVVLSVKEFFLALKKKKTDTILANILPGITAFDSGVSSEINTGKEVLYSASRQGNNVLLSKSQSGRMADGIWKDIFAAKSFLEKCEKKHGGLQGTTIILTIIAIVILLLSQSNIVRNLISEIKNVGTSGSKTEIVDEKKTDEDEETGSEEVLEEVAFDFNNVDGYIFPSDVRYINKEELYQLDKEEMALVRNEIYARHGYIFKTEKYALYFAEKSWYIENPDFDESQFNYIEKANKDLIVEVEKERGWR